ncbi:MAG: Serine--tRNA ligase [Alphaproteobacteria bacterium MarineAlpha6_Bin2]|nr:MAG: Serine--tRNA ligase [Alphaproteobacteria bacterium MarineAlpha6_Bin2]
MLDIKWIISNPDQADKLFAKRGIKPMTKKLIKMSQGRSESITNLEKLLERRNVLSKKIPNIKDKIEKNNLINEVKKIKNEISKLQPESNFDSSSLYNELIKLPNFLDEDVPKGNSEQDNKEIKKYGNIKEFNFKSKDHVEIGQNLKLMDFKTAAKVSGSRFVYLKGNLAMMERALAAFMLDINIHEGGFQEIYTPLIANDQALVGTGQLPKFDSDIFKIKDNYWLIPTSEVTLVNMVRESIIEKDKLPLRYTSYSQCFRSEAGAAGKDTRGMKRLHQFGKVELVSVTLPDQSKNEHLHLRSIAEKILQKLELHYRVCELCSAEVGFAAKKTYDIEVWIPSQKKYMEISSISNCGDFQARRINARFKNKEKKNEFVHTLNGSSLAVGRTIIAILENYQNKDGSISVPDILKKYMNNLERI